MSFDDAVKVGVARAQKTLKNVGAAWIENQEVLIDDKGQITEYPIEMKVSFIHEDLLEKTHLSPGVRVIIIEQMDCRNFMSSRFLWQLISG